IGRVISCWSSRFLEKDRFAVRAEDILERGPDLVQGAVRAGTLQDVWHNIVGAARGLAQALETRRARGVVAGGAEPRETLRLLARRGFVNLQQRDLQSFLGDKLIDPDDHAPVLLDFPLLARGALGDASLQPPRFETLHDAAPLVDFGEQGL